MADGSFFGGLGELLGQTVGGGQQNEDEALQQLQANRALFAGIAPPNLQQVNPNLQGASGMAGVSADPAAIAAQHQALAGLMQRGQEGYTLEDKAANQAMLNDVGQQDRAQRMATLQGMAQRGMGGGGAELAAQLSNQQGGAMRANQASTELAAQGRQRALEALMAGGQMSGQMRGQSFGEAATKARSQDEINARNAQMKNQGMYYNAQLPQQQFEDRMQQAGGIAGAGTTLAGEYDARANRARRMGQDLGNGYGQLSSTLGQAAMAGA